MKEIKFYGLNRKATMDLVGGELGNLQAVAAKNKHCPIRFPYFYMFKYDEAKALKANSFPLPVVVRIAFADNNFLKSKLINSFTALKNYIKQMRPLEMEEKNPILLVSRPPLKIANYDKYVFYLAHDYIAGHNLKTNDVVLFNTNGKQLFENNGLNTNFVYRIVRASIGYLFDGLLAYDDPRLAILRSRNIIDSFQDSEVLATFRNGYRNAFFNEDCESFGSIELSMASGYLGDPFTLGEVVGYDLSSKLRSVFGQAGLSFDGTLTKETLVRMKLNDNNQWIDRIQELVLIHNQIQTTEGAELAAVIYKYLNSWNQQLGWEQVLNSFSFAYDCIENKKVSLEKQNNSNIMPIPSAIQKLDVSFAFKADRAQLRIVQQYDNKVRVRFQTKNSLFEQYVAVDDEPAQRYSYWINEVMNEHDFDIKAKNVDSDFELFKNNLAGLDYDVLSLYGTSLTYVELIFQDQWFCDKKTGMKLFQAQCLRSTLGALMQIDYSGNTALNKVLDPPHKTVEQSENSGAFTVSHPSQELSTDYLSKLKKQALSNYNYGHMITITYPNQNPVIFPKTKEWGYWLNDPEKKPTLSEDDLFNAFKTIELKPESMIEPQSLEQAEQVSVEIINEFIKKENNK